MTGSEPQIVIKNNSAQIMPVSLFDLASITSNINSPITYQWNITGELYNNKDSVSIQVRGINQVNFQTYTYTSAQSITTPQQVVTILNSFGVGTFYLESGPQKLIKVDNNSLQYLQLDIYRLDNQLPVFANFNTSVNNNLRMNNTSTIEVVLVATDPDGDPITYSVDNLPAFGTLNQFQFAGVTYAIITFTTTGAAQNGTYNMTAYASDGFGATPLPILLLVDGNSYPRFIRPYISTRFIEELDNSQIWTYNTVNALTAATFYCRPVNLPWATGIGATFVRFFPTPLTSEIGTYIMGAFIRNGVGFANDSFLIRVTVIPSA